MGGAIGDWLHKRHKAGKRKTPNPAEVQALWFVRNRVYHYGAEALFQTTILVPRRYGSGTYGSGTYGGPTVILSGPMWRPSRRLPRGRSNVGRSEYDKLFAGEPVVLTLETISRTLARLARRSK